MTSAKIIILSVLMIAFMAASSEAGWLIYHESGFNGNILDIDTKQPIESAVVVVEYTKSTFGMGADNYSTVIDARETLTDKNGNFHFPSYSTLIQPFSWQIPTSFIIYKPGYASLEIGAGYFSGEVIDQQEGSWPSSEFKGLKYRLRPGIVELPKLKTREQRLIASAIGITDYTAKELPLLYKARNEEGKALGIK